MAGGHRRVVQELADGEGSPYLAQVLAVGDPLELRGPIGGWFVWEPARAPVPLPVMSTHLQLALPAAT